MIILDTEVVSEIMRGSAASPAVLNWVRGLAEQPVTTVVTRAEILAGVALLPAGQRRDRIESVATAAFDTLGVCLPLARARRSTPTSWRPDAARGARSGRWTHASQPSHASAGAPWRPVTPRTSNTSG